MKGEKISVQVKEENFAIKDSQSIQKEIAPMVITATPASPSNATVPKVEIDSWLLRLFESEFFDSRLAISYLYKYPTNVGIHHYICKELKKFHETEIRFLLPQICHIMISRPDESAALEEFTMSLCQTSHHMAILTLWYLESYLNDMQNAFATQSQAFVLCKRLYLACQAIVFSESSGSSKDLMTELAKVDIQRSAHVPPSLIGMGLILASVAAPVAHMAAKPLVMTQSKQPRFYNPLDDADSDYGDEMANSKKEAGAEDIQKMNERKRIWGRIFSRVPTTSPSLDELSKGSAFSFKNYIEKTTAVWEESQQAKSATADMVKSPLSLPTPVVGSFESINHRCLERSHYFYSEMQFIMTLVDISQRLVSVPRPARQGSLIAELSLLNHNLPANVCIPFWCPATSSSPNHHQVARIALSDCVVLNSADRVPFLMVVEVIENSSFHKSSKRNSKSSRNTSKSPIQKNSSGISEQEPELHKIPSNQDSVDYHQKVMSRRISAAFEHKLQRESVSGQNQIESKEGRIAVEEPSFDMSVRPGGGATKVAPLPLATLDIPKDESELVIPEDKNSLEKTVFSERMRTAAVMLAQLYQQQQKETAVITGGGKEKEKTRSRSSSVVSNSDVKTTTTTATADKRAHLKRKNEFEAIRARVLAEMAASEADRLRTMNSGVAEKNISIKNIPVDEVLAETQEKELQRDTEDPSASVFREPWELKRERIRSTSQFGQHSNWQLYSVIVKSGADLRQEQLALQLITEIQRSWEAFKIPVWVYPFSILITSDCSGLIEVIPDSISIHSIKKNGYTKRLNQPGFAYTIYDHFIKEFGEGGTDEFQEAQDNFCRSLAGYSLISYLLQLKDRHNGNILLDREGHITHIDFGFMLMNSPGSVGFELAPFKMPMEYVDVLGGANSEKFKDFRELVKLGFLALRKRSESILSLVEIMEKDSRLPCFTGLNKIVATPTAPAASRLNPVTNSLRERLQLGLTDEACSDYIDGLINSSCNNTFTALYDSFQYYANGIL